MKKIIALLLVVLVLAGCAGNGQVSKLSNGSEVIFKGEGVTYTNEDLYKSLKVSSAELVEENILNTIAKSYNVDTEEMIKSADETMNQFIELGYDQMIISYYGSLDAYRSMLISSQIYGALCAEMIKENLEENLNEDKPIKLQLAVYETKEEAEELVSKVNAGSTFDMAVMEVGENNDPQPFIYLDKNENVPLEVKEYLNTTDKTGLSTIITVQAPSTVNGETVMGVEYYVANVISRNSDEFIDEYVTEAASYIEDGEVKEYFFNKCEIKFYDQDLYELMSKENEAFK